ncbi:MAG: SpoIIE family protein phosphatase [Bdellovibrionales bacterium]
MNLKSISIRYKILIALTLIPAIALLAFVMIALQVFREDKKAYVFTTTSQITVSIASQLKNKLDNITKLTQPILLDLSQSEDFSRLSRAFLQFDANLQSMAIMLWDNNKANYQVGPVLEKTPYTFEKFWESWRDQWNPSLVQVFMSQTVVTNPFFDSRFVIVQKIERPEGRPYLVILLFDLSEFSQQFEALSAQSFYLIKRDGQILLGPQADLKKNLRDEIPLSFLDLSKKISSMGTETVTDKSGVVKLASFAAVEWGDLFVVSTVPESLAFSAVAVLKRKSLLFFVILLAFTTILSLLVSSTVTAALTQLFEATGQISQGHFDVEVKVEGQDEVGALAQNFNRMAAEVSRLMVQTAEKARMQNELQTARMVQETLFPPPRADLGPVEIVGYYEPASEVGGDWWSYTQIGGSVYLWIGDATGHGAGAALITSAAKSAAGLIESLGFSPSQALAALNRSIYDVSHGKVMMTFFLGKLDLRTLKMSYCNASHEAPFLFRRKDEPYKKKDIEFLQEVNNPRLGQSRTSEYKETTVQLSPGDLIYFYTDGVPDIRDKKNEAWGEREFIKSLLSSVNSSPSPVEVVSSFTDYFQAYRQDASLADDLTFFLVKTKENYIQEDKNHEQVPV